MKHLIVIIEDEEDMLDLLEYNLGKEGYDVLGFTSTDNIKQLLDEENVHLLIVDRNLPKVEGSDFVQELRESGYHTPVIFLTAKVSEEDKIDGFEKGGDDYITKPFNMKEVLLRIKSIIKRTSKASDEDLLKFRDITLDFNQKQAFINEESQDLTKLEFELLVTLIENKDSVLSRDYLLERVWGNNEDFQEKTVNVAIKRLKEKIDPDKTKEYIKTVRGVGYSC
jgi:two-component system, OmpR family, alkaline phosphatase synthesis response regulator PhoP